jgi:hypothetical protein
MFLKPTRLVYRSGSEVLLPLTRILRETAVGDFPVLDRNLEPGNAMSSAQLPPVLIISSEDGSSISKAGIKVLQVDGSDLRRAESFGAVLARFRKAGEHKVDGVEIFAPSDPIRVPPAPAEGQVWVPHVFCWQAAGNVALAWELSTEANLRDLFEVSIQEVIRWAQRPDLLIRLGRLACEIAPPHRKGGSYLSFRWLMTNQEVAAVVLSAQRVAIEHVSLHIDAAQEDAVVRVLTLALGFVEIPRPPSISIPGRWLQAGNSRVHINSREARNAEEGFPGTAPNHMCFAIADLQATELALQEQGIATERAGSLAQPQVWFRLPGGAVIELQPRS